MNVYFVTYFNSSLILRRPRSFAAASLLSSPRMSENQDRLSEEALPLTLIYFVSHTELSNVLN